MIKYLIFCILIILNFNANASIKNEIQKKLKSTYSVDFEFEQKINNKIEKGNCKVSYPKKIYCLYNDRFEKVMVSNGKSLIINSKKIINYYNYKLKDTPLNLILDKEFLTKKLDEIENINENSETYFFKVEFNNNLLTIFFDKNNYNIKGWTTIDVFNNKVETILFNVKTNLMLDNNIFKIKNYIN